MTFSGQPKYRISFILLAIVFIVSFSIKTFTQWLEDSVSYGNLNLSFTSETLDVSLDILHQKGRFYIAVPERGFSIIITHREIFNFVQKYRLSVKITALNVLGSLALLALIYGTIFIARNWYNLWQSFKGFLSALVGYSHFLLISFLLSLLMLASLFPLTEFLVWWQEFSFIREYPVPGSLERIIYDFMSEFVVLPDHRLFYAFFLTLPSFFLQLTITASLAGLIIFWMPVPNVLRALFERVGNFSGKINTKILFPVAALLLLGLTGLKSYNSNNLLPRSAEGTSMSFQAKIFQTGQISYPLPPAKEFFDFPYISNNIHWFSQFAPGWPALLSLGYWLRIPWLLSSLFSVGFLYIFYRFGKTIYDKDTATISCLFLIISPAFTGISAGFMHYSALLFFLWGFFYQARLCPEATGNKPALLAGILWGAAVTVAPKTSITFAAPAVFYLLTVFARRKNWARGGIFLATAALSAMPLLLYNYFQTGKWLVFGANSFFGASLAAQKKPFWDSLIFAIYRLNEINRSLFYWPIPALTFFFIFIILLRTDKKRWDYLLIFGFIGSFISHIYYIDPHPGNSNFLLAMVPLFVLFSARAVLLLPKWLSSLNLDPHRTKALMWVMLLWFFLPGLGRLLSSGDKTADLATRLKQNNIETAIVFLDKGLYEKGFGLTHPDQKKSPYIVARDLGKYNRKLTEQFPDRPAYRFHPYEEVEFVPLEEE